MPLGSKYEHVPEASTPAGFYILGGLGVGVWAVGRDELLHTGPSGLAHWLPNLRKNAGGRVGTIQGVRWNS